MIFSVFAFSLYAEDEVLELETSELSQVSKNDVCNSVFECCNEIVIIESSTQHDLNPQTTAYTSDTTILSGLYEGLRKQLALLPGRRHPHDRYPRRLHQKRNQRRIF